MLNPALCRVCTEHACRGFLSTDTVRLHTGAQPANFTGLCCSMVLVHSIVAECMHPRCLQVNIPVRAYLSTSPDLRIVSVACGHSHTLAIAETGSVWSCGRNGDGQ